MNVRRTTSLLVVVVAATGCGSEGSATDGGPPADALADAEPLAAPPDIPWLDGGVPPVALTPCPTGWHEVADREIPRCEPYPEGVAVEAGTGVGVLATGAGADLTLTRVVVRDTRGLADGSFGRGVSVDPGAHIDATALVAANNRELGVFAAGEGASMTLASSIVRDTQPQLSDLLHGRGLAVERGAQLTASGVLVESNHDTNVRVADPGSHVILTDVIVRDTQPRPLTGAFGCGVHVTDAGRLEASRLVVSGSREAGVDVFGAGTEAVLADALVRDTEASLGEGNFGYGLSVINGARLEAQRLLADHNTELAAFAAADTTELFLVDAALRDTRPNASAGWAGHGLTVFDGARAEARRLLVAGSREVGVGAWDRANLLLEDAVVRDTDAREADGTDGFAVVAAGAAHLAGTRVRVQTATVGVLTAIGAENARGREVDN